ncbi:MAG: DUF4263 domain-containing protein [bacterium]|nr:DUF4263 domain-containing protein [bacterium]
MKETIEIPEKYFDPKEEKFCVYEIYRKSKKTIYYLRDKNAELVEKIILDDFQGLPSGLYLNRSGYGFGKKGVFFLIALKNNLSPNKKLELIVSNKKNKSIKTTKNSTTIIFPYVDIKNLLSRLSRMNEDNNNELREAVASFLSTRFPKKIKISTVNFDEYKGGEIASILRRKKISQKLNTEDLQSLNNLFPKIFESALKGKRGAIRNERSTLIRNTKNTTDKIFLDEVIKEFEINLSKKVLNEKVWQDFLRDKVFRFLANYVTTIEKQNISLEVSYPDFVLTDVYGFIDIFEIKRHNTPLLSFDSSHENYYWNSEIAKAISQIENYIDEIIKNSDAYIKAIKRKKGVDIRVVRPRGYIIAGSSQQFSNEKESEDFRKLGVSLKNISFILYDELLENLKNLRSKL